MYSLMFGDPPSKFNFPEVTPLSHHYFFWWPPAKTTSPPLLIKNERSLITTDTAQIYMHYLKFTA